MKRFTTPLLGVTLAAAGLSVLTGDTVGAGSAPGPAANADGVALLRQELSDLQASGVPDDSPKVAMLRDDLASLEQGVSETAPIETGVDVPGMIARGARAEGRAAAGADTLVDNGPVPCEPIPPDLLTVADIANATCTSRPLPDGSTLYTATHPTGTTKKILFTPEGTPKVVP